MPNRNITFEYSLNTDEYIEIARAIGNNSCTNTQVTSALEHSMYVIKANIDGNLAGMGRVIGDGSLSCMILDICVKPEFRHNGIGTMLVNNLKAKISSNVLKGESLQILLVPVAGYEAFFKTAGFNFTPEIITGMYLNINK